MGLEFRMKGNRFLAYELPRSKKVRGFEGIMPECKNQTYHFSSSAGPLSKLYIRVWA